MKILILGISGRTGKLLAEEALKRGYKVSGIARDKNIVHINGAEIVEGTPYDEQTVAKAVTGVDAVVSVLGSFPRSQGLFSKLESKADFMSVSMGNTINQMKKNGIKRIILMTALGVGDSRKEVPAFFRFMIMVTNIKYAYIDHDKQEKLLEASGLDWTVVRPVTLTDKNNKLDVIYNLKGNPSIKSEISRKAVAHFILDSLEKGTFLGQKPGLSNA